MRIAEKMVEINFCASATLRYLQGWFGYWFAPSQRRERSLGYDLAVRWHGRMFFFQVKASNRFLTDGARRFHASHEQFCVLRDRAYVPNSIFYLFPTIGDHSEMVPTSLFADQCRFVDIHGMSLNAPSRASGYHLVDVYDSLNVAVFHSEPQKEPLVTAEKVFRLENGLTPHMFETRNQFEMFTRSLTGHVVGLVVGDGDLRQVGIMREHARGATQSSVDMML